MPDRKAMYQSAFDAFAKRDYVTAISRYEDLLREAPDFALGFQGVAEAHARVGGLDDAVRSIRRAIELDPTEPLYHTSLSRFLQQQGKISEAEEAAAAATRLMSKSTL